MAATNPRVFLDLTVGDAEAKRVVFELWKDVAPITAEKCLCTGERGLAPKSALPLHYKGSRIHRVIDGFMIQGGDFVRGTGSGGESIYGGAFDDENFDRPVDREGLLVMANRGPNTNGSQFFITVAPSEHLNGKHVCFGRVVAGYEHVLAISKLPTGAKDAPVSPVTVSHCGELEMRKVAKKPARPRSESVSSRSSSRSRSRSPSVTPPPRKKKHRSKEEKAERKAAKRAKKLKLKDTGRQDREPSPGMVALQEAAKAQREEDAKAKAQRETRAAEERERRLAEAKRRYDNGGREPEVNFRGSGRMAYRDDRGRSQGGMRGWRD